MDKREQARQRLVLLAGRIWAFSYSKDEIPTIIRYIENQAEHHKQQDMVNEYKKLLEESEVEYDEQKIFKQVDWFVEMCGKDGLVVGIIFMVENAERCTGNVQHTVV